MSTSSSSSRNGTPAERRRLTILFCDLAGSTNLSTIMDPEDLLELMVGFQQFCVQQIENVGGYVARFAGDGLLAYFGYPIAQEDAPERAVQAALELRQVGNHLCRPNRDQRLSVRIGVATGLVAVGDLVSAGARERTVAGETPNMAARLQGLAQPGTVLVSDATKRAVDGVFAFRPLKTVRLRGFVSDAKVWEVVGRRPSIDRYDGRRAIGLSPLVGRDVQLRSILQAWAETKDGDNGVVSIVGEAGIGKSRLLEEIRQTIGSRADGLWLEGGGASIYENSPFYVAAQIARNLAAAMSDEEAADLGQRLEHIKAEDATRENLMEMLTRRIWAAAERWPIALVIEDLHWVDPSTRELIDLILKERRARRLLFIYTSRTDDIAHPWNAHVHRRIVDLVTLDASGSAALARAAGGDGLSLAQVDAIVSRSAGVPLYVEELARLVAERPTFAMIEDLPPTLADLLTARLEAAGAAKRQAQVGAVLGHEFSATLFAAMLNQDSCQVEPILADLVGRAILVRRSDDIFAFRHALLAAAAYGMLSKRERRTLHENAARLILEQDANLADGRPEVVARHWMLAERAPEALAAWQAAGAIANRRRAFREAENAFRQALVVLESAGVDERDRTELKIRAALNRVLQITQGYSSSEAEASTRRTAELAEQVGDSEARAREEQVRWRSVFTAGDYAAAEVIVGRVMTLTEGHGDANWRRTFALRAGIQHGFYTGDLLRAERDFKAWSAVRDDSHRAAGDDVLSLGIGGLTAQLRGQHSEGLARIRGALELSEQRGNPYDLAMAAHTEACFHHFADNGAELALAAARLARAASDSGFEYASYLATGWLAIADLEAGHTWDGLERARATLKGIDRLGAGVSKMFWLGVLARAEWLSGNATAAEATFRRADACNRQERAFAPVTRMNRGRLLAYAGRVPEARREFRRVERDSSAMGAALFQFRALTALAGLPPRALNDRAHDRAVRAAAAISLLDHSPSDRERFAALTHANPIVSTT